MDFVTRLCTNRLLFDGGMGTMLQASGVLVPDCPELLNITHPSVVSKIHESYAKAGAEVVETNSLSLNAIALVRHHLVDRLEELVEASVVCARKGVGKDVLVALSVGPTGSMLKPMGTCTFDAMYIAFARQVIAGEAAGADIIYIETMLDIVEARIAVLAAKENTSLPIVCSFTYENGGRMLMGGTPECAVLAMSAVGIQAIATNCSGGPEQLLGVVQRTREVSCLPMIVQPNAGLPMVVDGKVSFPLQPQDMAQLMVPIIQAGALGIGGCCGTTPEHIAQFASVLLPYRSQPISTKQVQPQLCSQRVFATPLQALSHMVEVQGNLDALYEIEPGTTAAMLDLRSLSLSAIADLLDEGTTITRLPLCFKVASSEQAEVALRHYAGVAGVQGEVAPSILAKYGAMAL